MHQRLHPTCKQCYYYQNKSELEHYDLRFKGYCYAFPTAQKLNHPSRPACKYYEIDREPRRINWDELLEDTEIQGATA